MPSTLVMVPSAATLTFKGTPIIALSSAWYGGMSPDDLRESFDISLPLGPTMFRLNQSSVIVQVAEPSALTLSTFHVSSPSLVIFNSLLRFCPATLIVASWLRLLQIS